MDTLKRVKNARKEVRKITEKKGLSPEAAAYFLIEERYYGL